VSACESMQRYASSLTSTRVSSIALGGGAVDDRAGTVRRSRACPPGRGAARSVYAGARSVGRRSFLLVAAGCARASLQACSALTQADAAASRAGSGHAARVRCSPGPATWSTRRALVGTPAGLR
jgi:hypothetical protein